VAWSRYTFGVPRLRKSKQPSKPTEKTRAEDERLREELRNADPGKFKRLMKPLFGTEKSEKSNGR
jgi:hypothetical protein